MAMVWRSEDDLERQADKLLRRTRGIYSERDLQRRTYREIQAGIDFEWCDSNLIPEAGGHIDLQDLESMAGLTARQHQAVRLMRRLKHQDLVAAALSVTPAAVSQLLARACRKVMLALEEYREAAPSEEGWRLFMDEVRYKLRLIYRKRVTRKKRRRQREKKPPVNVPTGGLC